MLSRNKQQNQITVIESSFTIQQDVSSVFRIIIQSPESKVSLVRFPFDFIEFHQKISFYYPKCKLSFPSLRHCREKRLLKLFHRKTNAEKIKKYLERCFQHSAISHSSLLRDFTRVQRDEDVLLSTQPTYMTLIPAMHPKPVGDKPVPDTTRSSQATIDDFSLIRVLGKGCIGKVLLVRSKRDHRLYALKAIQKQWVLRQKELVHTRAERDILVCLRNQPFLVQLHQVFQTSSSLFLLLDYHSGGDLATQLSLTTTFTPTRTRFYAAEIVQGLSALHGHGIIYRDLKPENVLIGRDGHIVLTDFGLSKLFKEDETPLTHTFCGTAEYLAPEILLGEAYGFVVDFWSLGTLIYEMLYGITPFWAETHINMYRRVIKDRLQFPSSFDKPTRDFLSGLLEKEAKERLGWNGIQEIQSHPYFQSIDWTLAANRQLTPPYVPVIKDEADVSHFDELFTNMPVRISQSSDVQQDPFDSFDFDLSSSSLVDPQKNQNTGGSCCNRNRQGSSMQTENEMSFRFEIEQWEAACNAYDNQEYETSLKTFIIASYTKAIELDPYMAVARFQRGVSYFIKEDMESARANFDSTYEQLRGNNIINYQQLGLSFRLYACEVLFNRGICQLFMGKMDAGLTDLYYAQKASMTAEHAIIDQAVRDRGKGYSVFSIPPGVLFRPPENKLRQLQGGMFAAAVDQLPPVKKTPAVMTRNNSILLKQQPDKKYAIKSPSPTHRFFSRSSPTTEDSVSVSSSSRYTQSADSGFESSYSTSPPKSKLAYEVKEEDEGYGDFDKELEEVYGSLNTLSVDSNWASQEDIIQPSPPTNGKLKIKVHYKDTRILLVSSQIRFEELVLRIQEKFNISNSILLQYKDEENELVLLIDNDDLQIARQVVAKKMNTTRNDLEKLELWCVDNH
ncbi:hypothetical protein G6F55_008403 [Rhizopus delemar]|nr:hypothetical protein G6F55_008403 [Rhizopus delemar]KAG1539681.1 hypothetical protein G6F51_008985 [Rhizopus arrhizus]KAG1493796.1 hypothetical protein G6F54_008326 [Rhizopus delemar]KAG1511179.1 hypothetical protein G6F53_006131 [Rhizopus delemar]KAG1549182.1 hypothetical protein G6F49_009677 [Rhizopus delemar]